MAISFRCECGKFLTASDDQAGLEGQCPACDRVITIPQTGTLDMAGILDREEPEEVTSQERFAEKVTEKEVSESMRELEDLERDIGGKVEDQQERWSSGRSSRAIMLASILVVLLVALFVFMFVLKGREVSQEPIIIKKIQPSTETEEEASAPAVGAKLEEGEAQPLAPVTGEEKAQPEDLQPTVAETGEEEATGRVSTEPPVAAEAEPASEEKEPEVVASIEPETQSAKKVPPVGAFIINVASFRQKELALRYVEELKEKGIDAFDWEVDLPEKGRWYRVSVGNFPTRQEAESYAGELREKGLSDTFITQVPGTS